MAAGTVTPTVTLQWNDGHVLHVMGTMVVNAGDYVTDGIAVSFAGLVKGSQQAPKMVLANGIAGFPYRVVPGTTQANGLFVIYVNNSGATNAALPQHTVTAIVSGVTGDTISFYAIFAPFGR